MVRMTVVFWFFVFTQQLYSQNKRVYLFPGLGADGALFSKTKLTNCDTTIIRMPVPGKHEPLETYAKRISIQIDTTEPFYFIGVSLGGMIAIEIAKEKKPQKLILVSSAESRNDLPVRYRFQQYIPLYKIFSGRFYKRMTKLARPIMEPDSRQYDSLFNAMVDRKDPKFMKRSIGMICRWKNKSETKNVLHLHGSKDHTLPYRCVENAEKIKKGSHMMIYTKADEMNVLLNAALSGTN